MCINVKKTYNPYTHDVIYTPCGHCHECQQKRADAHLSRIFNHERDKSYFRVFITLNYANEGLPFIDLLDPANTRTQLHVYRSCKIYYSKPRGHAVRRFCIPVRQHLGVVEVNKFDNKRSYVEVLDGLMCPQKWHGRDTCIGVLWHKDFSDFICRLRKNLSRVYNLPVNGNIQYYKMGEYGPTTERPHFHAILYFPNNWKVHYQSIRRAIISAWPLCSVRQLSRNISIAHTGQRYVSEYCVRPSEYPDFLKIRKISQRPTFSRGFGYNENYFSPLQIQEMLRQRDFRYTYTYISKDGYPVSPVVPIPQYIMRRYFPYVKGSCQVSDRSLYACLLSPQSLIREKEKFGFSDDKEAQIYVRRIQTGQLRLGFSVFDYARAYMAVLSIYRSNLLKYSHSLVSSADEYEQFYDNIEVFPYLKEHSSPSVRSNISLPPIRYASCNDYPIRIQKCLDVEQEYQEHLKRSKLVDKTISLQTSFITYKLSKNVNFKKTKTNGKACALRA